MIADIILKIASEEGKEEEHTYYPRPSIAGPERCIRQLVYWGAGVERQPLPGRAVMIFSDSSFHEDLTGDWIRKSAYQLHSEQMQVDCGEVNGIHLIGHIDGVLTDITGTDRLFEHKAINHFTHQKYWAGEIPLDYVTQTCLYMEGAKKLTELKEALLLVKNKNTAQYLEFLIAYENGDACIINRTNSQGEVIEMGTVIPDIVDEAFSKFVLVKRHIEQKTLPPRQYDIDHWRCEYCGWNQVCWANWEAEFNELKTDEMLAGDVADMVRYYRELGGQKSEIEKEYKSLSSKIKKTMKDEGIREGKTSEYICRLRLEHRKEFTVPANTIEKLDIRKLRVGEQHVATN